MSIQKTEELLNKFNYNFERKNTTIIIKLDFALRITIDFSDPDKIKITDRLVGWNFLTGLIEMSLKNAMVYNFIGIIVLTFLFVGIDLVFDAFSMVFFFLAFIIWVLLFTIYYLAQSESMKQNLMRWNE